jgi:hypothetical protein
MLGSLFDREDGGTYTFGVLNDAVSKKSAVEINVWKYDSGMPYNNCKPNIFRVLDSIYTVVMFASFI